MSPSPKFGDNEWPLESKLLHSRMRDAIRESVEKTLAHLEPPERAVVMMGVFLGILPALVAASCETATGLVIDKSFEDQLHHKVIEAIQELIEQQKAQHT